MSNIQALEFGVQNKTAPNKPTNLFLANVNKETGAMDVYQLPFGPRGPRTLVFTSQKSSDWKPVLTEEGKKLTPEYQKFLLTDVSKQADNQRGAFINVNYTKDQKDKIFSDVPKVKNVSQTDPNTDLTPPNTDLTPDEDKYLQEESKKLKSRGKYDDVIYPIGLDPKFQDCIKFTIVQYKAPGLKGFGESNAGDRRVEVTAVGRPELSQGKERKILGTITLPIPGGIQDSNTVTWSGSELNPFMEGLGAIMQSELQSGKGTAEAQQQIKGALTDKSGLQKTIISKTIQSVVGQNNIMQRAYGTKINPNLELLFSNPDLRTFSFSFKLSPRSSQEAERVKKIIRTFKQAMSVKRTESSFLLATPDTFAISYIFKNENHPYLNKFKECALLSCNVNYTPEGNYMSFNDDKNPSMVSYQLDLTFQELEPIYNDDYGTSENDYNSIGF